MNIQFKLCFIKLMLCHEFKLLADVIWLGDPNSAPKLICLRFYEKIGSDRTKQLCQRTEFYTISGIKNRNDMI